MEERIDGIMEPGLGELKSSSKVGTGLETPGQRCLSNWEMERTNVGSCLLIDGSPDLKVNAFSLEEFVIGTQTDSQT